MHKVRWEGESLALVAKWYTGRPENWNAIAGANPTLDPKKIIVGNSIRIPSRLLITRKPMPKRFLTGAIESDAFPPAVDAGKVSAPAPAEKAGGPKAGPPAGKEEEPPLFGPKAYQE